MAHFVLNRCHTPYLHSRPIRLSGGLGKNNCSSKCLLIAGGSRQTRQNSKTRIMSGFALKPGGIHRKSQNYRERLGVAVTEREFMALPFRAGAPKPPPI